VASNPNLTTIVEQCTKQEGALALVQAIERRLKRPPPALYRLIEALATWERPIPIDDAVRDLIEAVDPVVEMGGVSVRSMLEAMASATRERAAAKRRTRETVRRRVR
jgi:hypothetical protein